VSGYPDCLGERMPQTILEAIARCDPEEPLEPGDPR
jgi:hypothetical protein